MDLSPKLLTDVQFREQWRGYNPDEVDEFLERVASGVEEIQQRLSEAIERASNAERRLLERSDDDEIRRTLVLAQRTAVASMEEARTEADRLVSETEVRCRQLVAEAEAQAARLDADIATRRRIELGDLAEQRAALQLDIDTLRAFADDERGRLADIVRGQLEWLDSGYSLADAPAVSAVLDPPIAPRPPVAMRAAETIEAEPIVEHIFEPELEPDDEPEPEPEPEPMRAYAPEAELGGSAVDELRAARVELADALRRAGVESDDTDEDDVEPLQLGGQLPRPALFDDRSPDATAAFDALADAEVASDDAGADEPADELQWRDEEASDGDDDPFLAELRRAVVDTEPLGPRDHREETPAVDLGDDEAPAGGFFRRGKRRG